MGKYIRIRNIYTLHCSKNRGKKYNLCARMFVAKLFQSEKLKINVIIQTFFCPLQALFGFLDF